MAEGGFSCVYLARDSTSERQHVQKHIICNDAESVDLVKQEVAVMKVLRGHPNVVTLHAQCRVCYALSVTPNCPQRSEGRKRPDGCGWRVEALRFFGSTSTNHKRFEKPDEMGLEEDIIRKHTSLPEVKHEKGTHLRALGCLLYRIAYFKSAFDGESKLQILNGNYRIMDAPKYSNVITDLIRSTADPSARPDAMQIWRQVNEALPNDLRRPHPDKPPAAPASRDQAETRTEYRSATRVSDKSAPSNDAAFNEFAAQFESSASLATDTGCRFYSDTSSQNQSDASSRTHSERGTIPSLMQQAFELLQTLEIECISYKRMSIGSVKSCTKLWPRRLSFHNSTKSLQPFASPSQREEIQELTDSGF
ncbi:hypothetical protein R1sor_012186 [Riccia sorocarpa]|uniref:non-specific serine/threonine protein kinase n=1 Tax=Riccia sorocarpa TaxID=122646 RepID=A0ABD3I6N9_9MARC